MAPSGQLPGRACPSRVQELPRLRAPGRAGLQPTSLAESDQKSSFWLGTGAVCVSGPDLNQAQDSSLTFLGSRAECSQVRQVLQRREPACLGGGRCEPGERLAARTAGSSAERAGHCGTSTHRKALGRAEAPWGWRSPSGDAGMRQGALRQGQA